MHFDHNSDKTLDDYWQAICHNRTRVDLQNNSLMTPESALLQCQTMIKTANDQEKVIIDDIINYIKAHFIA